MNNLQFNHFKNYINKNLLDSNIKISIDELLTSNFNNSYYLKNTLSNEQMDNILINIVKLVHYHKLNNEKLTLSFNFKKDCFILSYKDDKKDFNIFDNQENLLNIIYYLSNDNFQEIIKH